MKYLFSGLLLTLTLFARAEVNLPVTTVEIGASEILALSRQGEADVKIDGFLDDSIWFDLPAYDEFVVISPDTLAASTYATRVRIFYDASGLYFGIDMDQPEKTLISRLSGRDNRSLNRDSINITLDTSGEGRYGYWFGLNLGDSVVDGTLLPEKQFSSDWDGAWRGASKVTENGWSGEFHIPWGTMAMPSVEEKRRIGLYMSRKVAHVDERYGWPALPQTKPRFISELQSLSVAGINPKQQFSVFPFTAVTDDRVDGRVRYRTGADFFWRPSTNFQLTATINPDFGSVESDDVVINLSATETFFPEKRLFFLEGQDVFVATPRSDTRGSGVGSNGSPTTLLNTRRIGGQPLEPSALSDPTFSNTNLGEVTVSDRELRRPVDLLGAVKLTGQSGRMRYGLLAAFEDDVAFDARRDGDPFHLEVESSDYGVARLLYENQSGGSYKALGVMSTATVNKQRDAMTHGVDGHFLSKDGQWKIDGQVFMSDIENVETGYGGFVDLEYTFRQGITQGVGIEFLDEHVDINDLGFFSRQDNFRLRTKHTRKTSGMSWARNHEFDVRGFVQKNRDGLFTGGGVFISSRTTFNNLSKLTTRLNLNPKRYDDLNSFGNGAYRVDQGVFTGFFWQSDSSKPFSYGAGTGYANENLGDTTQIGHVLAIWRPNDRFAFEFDVFYRDRHGWLLHQEDKNFTTFDAEVWTPKISADYFITAKQQLRASLKWVGIKAQEKEFFLIPSRPGDLIPVEKPPGESDSFSLSQMSFQLRYRWEIAPLSDVFVVYTRLVDSGSALKSFSDTFSDGYDDPLGNFLVLKLRYRFGT